MRQKGAIEVILIAILALIVLATAAWYFTQSPPSQIPTQKSPQESSQESYQLSSSQEYIIEELGSPQAFHVTFNNQDRIETWFYYDQYATFNFRNGEFQSEHFDLEPLDESVAKRTASVLNPQQITQNTSPEGLRTLVGKESIEKIEEKIEGQEIDIYVYPKGVSASFDSLGNLLTFYAYPYYEEH